ncbi:hypothetical protein HBI39_014190 [Parastagonospora nodorum]|nr:hypothetical protein HBI39_014190 [Parastagonospora nodorum]
MAPMVNIRAVPTAWRSATARGEHRVRHAIRARHTRGIATNAAIREPGVQVPGGVPPVPVPQRKSALEQRIAAVNEAKPFSDFLTDTFSRQHDYLRISITERCNLRCLYCMPEEGIPLSPAEHMLTTPEIFYLSSLFVSQGVTKIRLTGGEPTVRRDIVPLMQQIGSLRTNGLRELALTTNGIALHRKLDAMVESGLTAVNLSLDTLDPFQFQIMTRRNGFDAVMKSINRILEMNKLGANVKLKVNCVVMRGLNEREIIPFVEMGREKDIEVRFIEYMPFGGNKWSQGKMISFQEMLDIIRAKYPDLRRLPGHKNDTSKTFEVPGFVGKVGFITSMTNDFCGSCNRLRITSDGNLKVCLHGNAEVSLRDVLRQGNDGKPIDQEAFERIKQLEMDRHEGRLSDETILGWGQRERELLDVVGAAVKRKAEKHADMGDLENMTNRPMILIDKTRPMVGTAISRSRLRTTPASPISPYSFLSTSYTPQTSSVRAYHTEAAAQDSVSEQQQLEEERIDLAQETQEIGSHLAKRDRALLLDIYQNGKIDSPLPEEFERLRKSCKVTGPEYNEYWRLVAGTLLWVRGCKEKSKLKLSVIEENSMDPVDARAIRLRHMRLISRFGPAEKDFWRRNRSEIFVALMAAGGSSSDLGHRMDFNRDIGTGFLNDEDVPDQSGDVNDKKPARYGPVDEQPESRSQHGLGVRARKLAAEVERLEGQLKHSLAENLSGSNTHDDTLTPSAKLTKRAKWRQSKRRRRLEEAREEWREVESEYQGIIQQLETMHAAEEQVAEGEVPNIERAKKLKELETRRLDLLAEKKDVLRRLQEVDESKATARKEQREARNEKEPDEDLDDILKLAVKRVEAKKNFENRISKLTEAAIPSEQDSDRRQNRIAGRNDAPVAPRSDRAEQPLRNIIPEEDVRSPASNGLEELIAASGHGLDSTIKSPTIARKGSSPAQSQLKQVVSQQSVDVAMHSQSKKLSRQKDGVHLKVPASGKIQIDENLTLSLNAGTASLQEQIIAMQARLRESYPRIDQAPFTVEENKNRNTLQSWLKVLVGRWEARSLSSIGLDKTDTGLQSFMDQMVRDHNLSNESAKRMAEKWKRILEAREASKKADPGHELTGNDEQSLEVAEERSPEVAKKSVGDETELEKSDSAVEKQATVIEKSDDAIDEEEWDVGGLGFLRADDTYAETDAPENSTKPAPTSTPTKKPSTSPLASLARRLYSTSSRPPVDPALAPESEKPIAPSASASAAASPAPQLPHLTPSGSAHMVSVSAKAHTIRTAIAVGTVHFTNHTPLSLIKSNTLKKGDVLGVSRIAGIMAAKKCPDLIPLCHPIALTSVGVEMKVLSPGETDDSYGGVHIEARVSCTGPTGVEMEALTSVMGAALSVVDMCKAVDRFQRICDVRVVLKEGGKSGVWREEGWTSVVHTDDAES